MSFNGYRTSKIGGVKKLTRKQALAAIKAAGTQGDKRSFTRLYVHNRISYEAAIEAYREGQRFAEFVVKRDAANAA